MAKGVKKIKWVGHSGALSEFSLRNKIICIKPNQEAPFAVGEWFSETTEEEKRRSITWLWMDQKKKKIFNRTIKPAGGSFGVTLPKKLCGSYAFYLEASLFGRHDTNTNTGLHVYGKCEKKITSSSWSKKENTADNSEINYGHDLFISLETEGVNGDTLTLESYSEKKTETALQTVTAKCINGTVKAKFTTMPWFMAFPGLPTDLENFYIKVLDNEGRYIKSAGGNDKIVSFRIKNKREMPVFEPPTNTTPLKVDNTPIEEEIKTEGIITAYFAKEEFTLETAEVAEQYEYKFKNKNANIDKDKIAAIIKKNVDPQVKADKKYAKLDDIKNALTKSTYETGESISFNLYKLGANFIKINSAPLEEEVYVVAKTFLLDGKEVSITIKEKESILEEADADLTVLEAKEDGAELTTLKATVEKGLAKVKIKLRPKADEDLKTWKEKLLKGKKDESYTYTFKNETVITDANKKQFATIILNNAKEGKQGNTKIATGKTAFVDDVEKALESKTYGSGTTISFDTYKTQAENLWLKAECQGDSQKHEKEFLKRDGEYFVIGKKCECEARVRAFMRMLRVKEGTEGEKGYTMLFAKKDFIRDYGKDRSTHPEIVVSANGYSSSAAGAYQIMADTYNDKGFTKNRNNYNINSFDQESQDKLCVTILKHNYVDDRPSKFYNPIYWKDVNETERDTERENKVKEKRKKFKGQNGDIIKMLINNNYEKALLLSSLCWASLPDSPYGQPVGTKEQCKSNYEKFLKEELEGKSDLYIKKGFLKEFGYECCSATSNNANWHEPVDNPISTIFTQSQSGGEFNHSGKHWGLFGNTRSGSAHAGLDLFAKKGTAIYACVDGTVYNRRWHGSYGNTITIKVKDKEAFLKLKKGYKIQYGEDGEMKEGADWSEDGDIFLFYAHLDSVKEYNFNDEVKCGETLGTTGRSGVTAGTCAPHLHFEILCDYTMAVGHKFRLNPGFYVNFKSFDEQSQQEKLDQQTEAKQGKIIEFEGQNKLDYDNMANFKK